MSLDSKTCARCKLTKSLDDFYVCTRTSTGTPIRWHSYCKRCQGEIAKANNSAHRKRQKRNHAQEARNIALHKFESNIDIFVARLEANGYTVIERRRTRKTKRYSGGKTYRVFTIDPAGKRVMFRTARKGSTWGNREVNPNAVIG